MDILTVRERSDQMRLVRSKDTAPELAVRSLLHKAGYRFRTHVSTLPGRPDIVFSAKRCVVFVHGCFWHGHDCRAGRNRPSTNTAYWGSKLARTKLRDALVIAELANTNWRTITVWECELRALSQLLERLERFLGPPSTYGLVNIVPRRSNI